MNPTLNSVIDPSGKSTTRSATGLGGTAVYSPVTGGMPKELDRSVEHPRGFGRGDNTWATTLFRTGTKSPISEKKPVRTIQDLCKKLSSGVAVRPSDLEDLHPENGGVHRGGAEALEPEFA